MNDKITTLKASLTDWQDCDGVTYDLALCLGLMSPKTSFSGEAKHVFWTDNPIGTFLYTMLDEMVDLGVLEKRDEPDFQYRWNQNFRGSWGKL